MDNTDLAGDGRAYIWLHPDAEVDLVVDPEDANRHILGLRLRRYNDVAPISFVPKECSTPLVITTAGPNHSRIFVNPSLAISSDIISVSIANATSDQETTISIPLINQEIFRSVINVKLSPHPHKPAHMLTIQDVQGFHVDGFWRTGIETDTLFHKTAISDETHNLILVRTVGQNRDYVMILAPITPAVAYLTCAWYGSEGRLEILLDATMDESQFLVSIFPASAHRRLAGHPTSAMVKADLALIAFAPLQPRIFYWLASLVPELQSIPLAVPPVSAPRFTTPLLGFAVDGGWAMAGRPSARGPTTAVLLGSPTAGHLRPMLLTGKIDHFYVMTDSPEAYEHLKGVVISLSHRILTPKVGNLLAEVDGDDDSPKTIELVLVEEFEPLGIERLLYDIVSMTTQAGHQQLELWRTHMARRLPAVPFISDLAVGAICVVVNLLRGRAPVDDGTVELDYNSLKSAELWLIPWSSTSEQVTINGGRSELMAGLILRSVSEYTAVRAFSEMYVGGPQALNPERILESGRADLLDCVSRWIKGGWSSLGWKDMRENFTSIVDERKLSHSEVIATIAQEVFDLLCSGGRDPGYSFVNPLVLVVASGRRQFDSTLELDLAFWASYAGRMSARKPGSIVPTLLASEEVAAGLELHAVLREAYSSSSLRTQVLEARRLISRYLERCLEPAARDVLEKVGADRIVTFSDFPLDYMLCGTSYLGLEVPLSRIPASDPAIMSVGYVLDASMYHLEPPSMSRRAVILVAQEVSDAQTEWSLQLANDLKERLSWIGLIAQAHEIHSLDSKARALEIGAGSSVVIFLGHAEASDSWAALNFGKYSITLDEIGGKRWDGCVAILVGCETSALDTKFGDIGREFLRRGARAVVATNAPVRAAVASYFFEEFLAELVNGSPIDYSFFTARRRAVVYESLVESEEPETARLKISTISNEVLDGRDFRRVFAAVGLLWASVDDCPPFAMSFTLLGGAGEAIA